MSGILYVVATPIGNLDDLTPRARKVLAEVDIVAAEDTRRTGRLLFTIGAKKRILALHEHNESERVAALMAELESGRSVAIVSDAGTPLISDPGFRLVQAAHEGGIGVAPIAGPSAVTAALSVAGLPTDRFCFEGFLPAKASARRGRLAELVTETRTMVFFEAVHRVADTMTALCEAFGEERPAFVGRELTKLHEQCVKASLGTLQEKLAGGEIVAKGEIVICVHGAPARPGAVLDVDRLLKELKRHHPPKEAAGIAAKATGGKKNALYRRLLELE